MFIIMDSDRFGGLFSCKKFSEKLYKIPRREKSVVKWLYDGQRI